MLRYDQYLAAGYPIGTGVIEGACRSLVKDRMERTGARWSLPGAEAVLRLRARSTKGISSRTGCFIWPASTSAIMLHVLARSPTQATHSVLAECRT